MFRGSRKKETGIVQILTQDGSRYTDRSARKIAGQFIIEGFGGISVRVRKPTPSYVHRHVGRQPETRGAVQVETSDSVSPYHDSKWVLKDSQQVYESTLQGLDESIVEKAAGNSGFKRLVGIAGVLFLLFIAVFVAFEKRAERIAEDQTPPPATAPAEVPGELPPPPASQPGAAPPAAAGENPAAAAEEGSADAESPG